MTSLLKAVKPQPKWDSSKTFHLVQGELFRCSPYMCLLAFELTVLLSLSLICVLARICLKHIPRVIHVYVVACGLEVRGCSHDFDELRALFICVSSLEQALVP